jgi:hypothetical protein
MLPVAVQCCAMTFRRLITISILLLSIGANTSCTMWGEKKHPNWKQATSGEHLVNLFWKDVEAKRWQDLESHVGSSFVGISPNGTSNHDQVLEHLRAMDLKAFQIGEVNSQMAGNDLIVTYTITARGTVGGQPLPSPLRMMSIWQELRNGWILVAHSTVPMAGNPAPKSQ